MLTVEYARHCFDTFSCPAEEITISTTYIITLSSQLNVASLYLQDTDAILYRQVIAVS